MAVNPSFHRVNCGFIVNKVPSRTSDITHFSAFAVTIVDMVYRLDGCSFRGCAPMSYSNPKAKLVDNIFKNVLKLNNFCKNFYIVTKSKFILIFTVTWTFFLLFHLHCFV